MSENTARQPFNLRILTILAILICTLVIVGVAIAEVGEKNPADEAASESKGTIRSDDDVSPMGSRAPVKKGAGEQNSLCVEEPAEPLPSSSCYRCFASIPTNPNCPAIIKCVEATQSGKSFCSITWGGGEIKCETSGPACTSV